MVTELLAVTYLRMAGGDRERALMNARNTLESKEADPEKNEIRLKAIERLKEVIKELEEQN